MTYFTTKKSLATFAKENALHVSNGNLKLVPNEITGFIIWSLPAIKTCPFATEMCKKFCYAMKAERCYPSARIARAENFDTSRRADFVENMITYIVNYTRLSGKKKIIVRIHESGDFYNREYAEKWLRIAESVRKECKNVKFVAYTKSIIYFDGVTIPENFILRASVWADTNDKQLALIAKNNLPIYTAVESFKTGDTFFRCRCKDCATCNACFTKRADIRCEIH